MKELRARLIGILSLFVLATGWGGYWLFQSYFPASYFNAYPLIPVFYFIMGAILIGAITREAKISQAKLVNLYMLLKLTKLMACGFFALIYYFAVKVQMREFGMTFLGFFLLFLGLETYFFYCSEKIIKMKNANE